MLLVLNAETYKFVYSMYTPQYHTKINNIFHFSRGLMNTTYLLPCNNEEVMTFNVFYKCDDNDQVN